MDTTAPAQGGGGRSGKRRRRRGGRRKKGGGAGSAPASRRTLPRFGPSETVALASPAELDALLQRDHSAVRAVLLSPDFDVRDSHVIALADAFGSRLESMQLGDSDTGNGVWVTDAAVLHLVRHCPQLQELALRSCTNVSTAAFEAIAAGLPNLLVLHCTGHDKTKGKLTNKALAAIVNGALQHLQRLYITDQQVSYNAVQNLIQRRRGSLQVLAGETDSDSYAWSCVLQEMGRNYGDGLFGNMGGHLHGDFGFGSLALDDYSSDEEDLLWLEDDCCY